MSLHTYLLGLLAAAGAAAAVVLAPSDTWATWALVLGGAVVAAILVALVSLDVR